MSISQKQLEETWLSEKVEIRNSPTHGRGLFAVERITKNEPVLVWGGEYVNSEKAKKAENEGKLVMQWDEDLYSIEDRGDDRGYFLNHSCNPNVWMNDVYTLIAKRDIEIGEEVTADYALWEANENKVSKWKCQCGSKECRLRVTGKDWQLPVLQERYRGHFSPLINKRIAGSKFEHH